MHFDTLPVLLHPEVTLRWIEAGDLPVWAAYLRLPVVFEHTSWNLGATSELEPHVWRNQPALPDASLRFALACKASGQMVGSIGFHTVSARNRSAELAYDLAPTHWGRGIARAATRELTAWAHEHAGMVRVQATVLETNLRSMQVLQDCGYEREGLLRSFRQVRGTAGNFWMYAHIA